MAYKPNIITDLINDLESGSNPDNVLMLKFPGTRSNEWGLNSGRPTFHNILQEVININMFHLLTGFNWLRTLPHHACMLIGLVEMTW